MQEKIKLWTRIRLLLDASDSYDADGNISSYSWIQNSGDPSVIIVNADSPKPDFTAPRVDTNSTLTFKLTVTDNSGASNADYVNILIENTNNTVIPPPEGKITLDKVPVELMQVVSSYFLAY